MDQKPKTTNPHQLKAGLGTHIEVELLGKSSPKERLSLDIVPDRSADFSNGFLGLNTPLARAILGQTAGSVVPYQAEDISQVRILSVEPSRKTPSKDVHLRREETIRKAVEDADRTNAMIFASSFSGKWGDYDPQGFVAEPEEGEEDDSSKTG